MNKNIQNIAKQVLLILLIGSITIFAKDLLAASDPLAKINTNVKTATTTFQLIALSIAGIGLICVLLAGMFTQLNKAQLLQITAIILGIAGAVLIIDWIAGWVK